MAAAVGAVHFASHGGSASHSSRFFCVILHAFHGGGVSRLGRSSAMETGTTIGRFLRTAGLLYPYYGMRDIIPTDIAAGGMIRWPTIIHDTADDQDSYAGFYQAPAYPGPYADNSGLQRDVQTLNGKIDRLQADVEARNRPKTDENRRRRWCSATSMWKKCITTRSPAGRSGCSMTTRPGRRFRWPSLILTPRSR
jgi:hypothetical protein